MFRFASCILKSPMGVFNFIRWDKDHGTAARHAMATCGSILRTELVPAYMAKLADKDSAESEKLITLALFAGFSNDLFYGGKPTLDVEERAFTCARQLGGRRSGCTGAPQ